MLCDGNTCPEKYVDEKFFGQGTYDSDKDEFIKNLKQEKCKIIQLVRRQMRKFYDTQYKASSISNGWQTRYMQESPNMSYIIKREVNITEDTNKEATDVQPRRSIMSDCQALCLRTLGKIRKKICMTVLIAGIIILMVVIYGIYFRAYLCNNGKSCITSLQYTHVKHALF